jgi:hypothetical protein
MNLLGLHSTLVPALLATFSIGTVAAASPNAGALLVGLASAVVMLAWRKTPPAKAGWSTPRSRRRAQMA